MLHACRQELRACRYYQCIILLDFSCLKNNATRFSPHLAWRNCCPTSPKSACRGRPGLKVLRPHHYFHRTIHVHRPPRLTVLCTHHCACHNIFSCKQCPSRRCAPGVKARHRTENYKSARNIQIFPRSWFFPWENVSRGILNILASPPHVFKL